MAKDDYPVIVYQILAYLYSCLKKGEPVEPDKISANSDYFKVNQQTINQRYWEYIMYQLSKTGMIEGVTLMEVDNRQYPVPVRWDDCMITPKGIEYLTDNSFLRKAEEFLKEIKAIVPFI